MPFPQRLEKAGQRLAAGAGRLGRVRAPHRIVEAHTAAAEQFLQTPLAGSHRLLIEIAPPHAGLVRHHKKPPPVPGQPRKGGAYSRQKDDARGIGQIMTVLDERPVAVKQHCAHKSHEETSLKRHDASKDTGTLHKSQKGTLKGRVLVLTRFASSCKRKRLEYGGRKAAAGKESVFPLRSYRH